MKRVYRGATLPIEFGPVKDATGTVVVLTGATVKCKARQKGEAAEVAAASAYVVSGPAGTAKGVFSAAQTATWTVGGWYEADGIATLSTGEVVPLGEVDFQVDDLVSVD